MQSRIIIVHGWADDPRQGWLSWLAVELQKRGHQVVIPHFVATSIEHVDLPAILAQLHRAIGELQPDDVFVGHSLGVSLILRTLMDFPATICIRGLVLVAGLATSERRRPNALFDPPLDFERLTSMAQHRIVIRSDDDSQVLPQQTDELAKLLYAELRIDPGKGHFLGLRGLNELPSVLQAILDCLR